MKSIFFSLTLLTLSTIVTAQQDSTARKTPDKWIPDGRYCVMLNGGKAEVTLNGKPLKADVELKNGTKLTATGTLIRRDGTIQMIKPGSCVNTEGNEVEHADRK